MRKIFIILFICATFAVLFMLIRGDEDKWICQNGEWIKHGNPGGQKPEAGCGSPTVTPFPQNSSFQIFLGNRDKSEESVECKAASPVKREVPYTVAVAKEAIDALLAGPTEEELNTGYYTSINRNVTLQKIVIKDGTVTVDFDENLEKGIGGSCKVTFIRSQIVNTLKQFPDVKEVTISINGRTEDILQP